MTTPGFMDGCLDDVYVDVMMTGPAVTNPAMIIRDHRHLATNDLELDIYETPCMVEESRNCRKISMIGCLVYQNCSFIIIALQHAIAQIINMEIF